LLSCPIDRFNMPRGGGGRKSMSLSFTISDLRQRPEFLDTVADRIWQAWWRETGHPLDYIAGRLHRENLNADPIPFALVAHDGAEFLGTSSVIEADLPERPQLTPWVAAVWVEPQARRRGVGAALVDRAVADCFALGVIRAYLCARRERAGFYQRLGWIPVEGDVGPHHLDVFIRDANPAKSAINSPP
jgi:N-acetylglutamate synthase-like GNAT family acetyltransferase